MNATSHGTPNMSMISDLEKVQHLHWDEGGLVIVTPQDQDRFGVKIRRAIEILQLAGRVDEFENQFNLLLGTLGRWLKCQDNIARAFLTHRDGALAFVVVRSESQCDDAFEDELSDLDYAIANDPDLNLIRLHAMALPPASDAAIGSFLDPGFIIEYRNRGERGGPSGTGQQEP